MKRILIATALLLAILLSAACGPDKPDNKPIQPAPNTAVADSILPDPSKDDDDDIAVDDGDVPIPTEDVNVDMDESDDDDLLADGSSNSGKPSGKRPKASGELGLVTIPTNRAEDPAPDPAPNEFVQLAYEPTPLNLVAVRQAINQANTSGVKGKVYLKILVDKDGYYKRHIVRRTPDERLTEAVVAGVKRMKWSPASTGSSPTKAWVAFDHSFE